MKIKSMYPLLILVLFLSWNQQTALGTTESEYQWEVDAEGSAVINASNAYARADALGECFKEGIRAYLSEEYSSILPSQVNILLDDISDDLSTYVQLVNTQRDQAVGNNWIIEATVKVDKIQVGILLRKHNLIPRREIMVVIPEEFIRLPPPPDPAAETVIVDGLIDAEYILKDQVISAEIRYGPVVENAFAGDPVAMRGIFEMCNAEILVIGEAFAEEIPAVLSGMHTCRARVEIKAVQQDGTIISSVGMQGTASDPALNVSAKLALENAARNVLDDLLADLVSIQGGPGQIEVNLSGCESITQLASIENQIRNMEGVLAVDRLEFRDGTARIKVALGIGWEDFAVALEAIESPVLRITYADASKIDLEISTSEL
jgi:hypothetical protein